MSLRVAVIYCKFEINLCGWLSWYLRVSKSIPPCMHPFRFMKIYFKHQKVRTTWWLLTGWKCISVWIIWQTWLRNVFGFFGCHWECCCSVTFNFEIKSSRSRWSCTNLIKKSKTGVIDFLAELVLHNPTYFPPTAHVVFVVNDVFTLLLVHTCL